MEIKVQEKLPKRYKEDVKISKSTDVPNLKEVQEIQNARQEHLLLIGLNGANEVLDINVLGIGTSSCVSLKRKDLIETALLNGYDKVILVHNHPANQLKPSQSDIELTNIAKKMFKAFDIELLDHIIVTKDNYRSMYNEMDILENYSNKDVIESIDNMILQEENLRLKEEIKNLREQIEENEFELAM